MSRDRVAGSLMDRIAGSTSVERDRVIDALRVGSLLVVVMGHWLMAGVAVVDGRVTGSNSLASMPGLHPLTWVLQVMPLFFVAGGFANLTVWRRIRSDRENRQRGGSYSEYLRGRMTRLLGPVLVFALLSQVMLGIVWAAGVAAEDVAFVGRLLGRPLWFLVVYLLVTAAAPMMAAWHERSPVLALSVPAAAAVLVDVARMSLGAADPAYLNFLLVWLVAQQLGFWYADGRFAAVSRGSLLTVVAAVVAVLAGLTVAGPYPVSMIGLPGEMSNMSPPSVCLMLLALGQTMMVMLVRPALGRWLERPPVWAGVVVVSARAMTLYLWHLVALVVVAGLALLVGAGQPDAGTVSWWLTRPLWLGLLGVVLVAITVPVSRLERFRVTHSRAQPFADETSTTLATLVVGLILVTAGLLGYTMGGLEPFGSAGEWPLGLQVNLLPSSSCLVLGWLLVQSRPT